MSLACRLSTRVRTIQRTVRASPLLRLRTIQPTTGTRTLLVPAQLSVRPISFNQVRRFSETTSTTPESASETSSEAEEAESQGTEGNTEEDKDQIISELRTQLSEAEKQAQDFKNAALEYKAEVYNVRTRGQKETENAKRFAIEKFAKDILVVADNIDLALKNVEKPGPDADKGLVTLYEGLEMTQKTCEQVFLKFNVKKAESMGLKFDTSIHEVLFQAPIEGKESGEIFEVVRDGYWLGDRALRSAQVGVVQ